MKTIVAETWGLKVNTFEIAPLEGGPIVGEEEEVSAGSYLMKELGGATVRLVPRRPWMSMRAYQDFVPQGRTLGDLSRDIAQYMRVRTRQVTIFETATAREPLDPTSVEIPESVYYEIMPYLEFLEEERTPATSEEDSEEDSEAQPLTEEEEPSEADPANIHWHFARIDDLGGPREEEHFILRTPRGWRPTLVSMAGRDPSERALRPWCARWLECPIYRVQLAEMPQEVCERFGVEQLTAAFPLPSLTELAGGGKKKKKDKKASRIVLKSRSRTPPEQEHQELKEKESRRQPESQKAPARGSGQQTSQKECAEEPITTREFCKRYPELTITYSDGSRCALCHR